MRDIELALALVLGVTVVATLARRLGLPPRPVTVLEGDSLVNDATALPAPYAAYLPAEAMGASGILAVVVAGLYLNRFYYGSRGFDAVTSSARLQIEALWRMIVYLVEGVVFALIGLQLPTVLERMGSESVATLVRAAVAVSWLGPDGQDRGPDGREDATARHRTATVALAHLDELVARQAVPEAVEQKLRRRLEERQRWAAKRLDGDGQMATRVQAVHANHTQVRRAPRSLSPPGAPTGCCRPGPRTRRCPVPDRT